MSALVTGEAVVLELRIARLASRALSVAIDFACQLTALFVAAVIIGSLSPVLDEAAAAALILTLTVGVLVGYPVLCETLTRGRTVGKIALGLRVVRDDGGPIRFRHALARGLVWWVDFPITAGAGALLCSLASPQGKRLGDLLAGTVVIRERMPVNLTAPPLMPPGLASWAALLDLSQLPEATATQARQLLARWQSLAPDQRDALAARLAAGLVARVTPPPPTGVPPVAYLSAVLAERHRREVARMMPSGHHAPPPGMPASPYGQAPSVQEAPYGRAPAYDPGVPVPPYQPGVHGSPYGQAAAPPVNPPPAAAHPAPPVGGAEQPEAPAGREPGNPFAMPG